MLPGNAGFDLRITRIYNSSLFPDYDNGSTALDEDSWAGVGWRLHFGRVINPYATTGGATSIEFGDGTRQPLYTTTAYPEGWMTPGFARYDRSNHRLKLPNGYVYTFGYEADHGGTLGIVRYVTEIRDPFNNKIEFSYFGEPGPVDGVSQIRQYLSATEVRVVNFTYDTARDSLATMSYAGRTWTYVQDPHGSSGYSTLQEVRPPLGPPERYDYTALPGELTRIETPSGGVVAYTYEDADRPASVLNLRTRVVAQRSTSGRSVTGGTWEFDYGRGPDQDTTVITCACDGSNPIVTKYVFHGTGLTGDFSAWKSGAQHEVVIEQGGVVRERQTFTWIRSEPISPDPIPGQSGVWSDPAVYAALLRSVTVTRDGQSWTTTHDYQTTNFNDFGQPWKTTETGDFTRTTERTFQTGFGPHIIGRIASTWTRVGPEGIGADWDYDLATGFLTRYVGPQSPARRFTPRADGNLAWVSDALNRETRFENYTWGQPEVIRTAHTRTDYTINPDGSIASAASAVTAQFEYDALFRQTKIRNTGANDTITFFDNTSAAGVRVERGGIVVATTALDGFGRPVQVTAGTGVTQRTTFDACGRPVFASMPYTAGTGTTGTTTTYDALGRVKTVTGPDGAVTQFAYAGIDVTVTDAEGRTTFYDYSAAGSPDAAPRLVAVRDAANVTTTYTYDVIDILVRVSGPGPVPDRTWVHNGTTFMSDTQPESGTTTYVHDAAGNLTRKTDAKGQIFDFSYDDDNRLRTVDAPGTIDDLAVTYDTHGRLLSQATPGALTTFAYNAAGQLASRTDTVGAASFVSLYEYDLNENLTKITYPSGRVVTYAYDLHNRLTTVRQNGAIFADQFTYDDAGRLASYRTGAVTHTVTYDAAGRTKTLTSGSALNLTYAYDGVGNVKTITEPAQPTQQFGYDALNRLTSASGPWGQRGWQYSPSGDRLVESGAGMTAYQYDAATRRLMSTTGARAEAFTYNAVGEMTADGRGTYAYNPSGLVTQFTGPNVSAAYTYDPAGLRIAKTVNSVTTYTVRSSGGSVLSEYRGACGAAVWNRDILYAGGRLLGSIKATNTEPTVGLTQGAVTVAEGTATLNATITLTTPGGGPLPCPLTVNYNAIDATASAGADFRLPAGSVTFNPGDLTGATRTLSIEILGDAIDEHDETFTVTLASAVGAQVSTAAQVITITDDDGPPVVSIANGSIVEPDGGSAVLPLVVSLSAASGKTVTVAYSTANGSAVAPADFTSFTNHVAEFAPGVVSQTVFVTVAGDMIREIDESLSVTLSMPGFATLGTATASATIYDNDRIADARKSDFNNDGKPDLLWRNDATGALVVWLMDGTTLTTIIAPSPNQSPPGLEVVGTADFYNDGAADIVWQEPATGNVSIWVMAGLNRLWVEGLANQIGDPNWRAIAVADVNADNHPDLIWRHTDGWVLVSLLIGRTTVAQHLLSPEQLSAPWQLVATGDLDQDGFTDLVWQNTTTGQLVGWQLNVSGHVGSYALSPGGVADVQWKVRGGADFDRDGMTDLIWQHTATGEIAVWLMNGPALRTVLATTPGQLADLTWRIVAPK